MDTDMDQVVDAALDRFLTRMQGHWLPSAPLADKWAQASAAAVVTDPARLVPHIRAIKGWLEGCSGGENDFRDRQIALVMLCDWLNGVPEDKETAGIRTDPALFVRAAQGMLDIDFGDV